MSSPDRPTRERTTIIRVDHNRDNPFVQIHRELFENSTLSWKAKGLMGYLLSRPRDWEIRLGDLVARSRDQRDSVYSAIRELRRAGYVDLETVRGPRGQFAFRRYVVYEDPSRGRPTPPPSCTPHAGKPDTGKPDSATPYPGNPPLQINKGQPMTNDTTRITTSRPVVVDRDPDLGPEPGEDGEPGRPGGGGRAPS